MATLADLNCEVQEVRLKDGYVLVIQKHRAFWTTDKYQPGLFPPVMQLIFDGPDRVSLAVEHYNECFPKK